MIANTNSDEETDSQEDAMQADGTITNRSDFWVGLLVLGGLVYGLLVATRVIFF